MSMISEQIKRLREKADTFERPGSAVDGIVKEFRQAADTIEELSAKLQAANMDRSSQYYNGGWIPVSERFPEFTINKLPVGIHFTEDVLVYDGADLRVGYFARKDKLDRDYWVVYGDDYFEPIAWMPLPLPYKASPTGAESEE